ncbi:MAG: hypothetical protein QXG62_04030 [Saccharolobus sp.]
MPVYTYCVSDKFLVNCEKGDLYYIFEYTKNNDLLLSKCVKETCYQVEDVISELKTYKFLDEVIRFDEILNKIEEFRHFLIKYNLKIYFIGEDSILEAIYNPLLYYYKYYGLRDYKRINLLKIWIDKLVLLSRSMEEIGIGEFKSHMDSLDGRYALWVNTDDHVTKFLDKKGSLFIVWINYKGCDIFIQKENSNENICIKKD